MTTATSGKLKLSQREAGRIEGYAAALSDMIEVLSESIAYKSYDPMTVKGREMWSYAFNMKDGHRQHPISDYSSVEEICAFLLSEALDKVDEAKNDGFGIFHESTNGVRSFSRSIWNKHYPHARSQDSEEQQQHYGLKDWVRPPDFEFDPA